MNVDPWEQPGEGLPEAEPQAFKEVSEDAAQATTKESNDCWYQRGVPPQSG